MRVLAHFKNLFFFNWGTWFVEARREMAAGVPWNSPNPKKNWWEELGGRIPRNQTPKKKKKKKKKKKSASHVDANRVGWQADGTWDASKWHQSVSNAIKNPVKLVENPLKLGAIEARSPKKKRTNKKKTATTTTTTELPNDPIKLGATREK